MFDVMLVKWYIDGYLYGVSLDLIFGENFGILFSYEGYLLVFCIGFEVDCLWGDIGGK